MTDNKWIARGIKEEGTFAYGYYYYDIYDKKHYILAYDLSPSIEHGLENFFTEIIQEPDRSLGIKDIEGKDIFERDKIQLVNKEIFELRIDRFGVPCLFCATDSINLAVANEKHDVVFERDCKIIGNTHGIK